jgi:hypothetical protein
MKGVALAVQGIGTEAVAVLHPPREISGDVEGMTMNVDLPGMEVAIVMCADIGKGQWVMNGDTVCS